MIVDFLFGVTTGDIIYDIETYPNVFTMTAKHTVTDQTWVFEISHRKYELELLCKFIEVCSSKSCRWVGFNNLGFDYPVIHLIYKSRNSFISVADIYNKAMSIINSYGNRVAHLVRESDWVVDQVDLFKIHHFDNQNKSTSLKVLEFNMRMSNIQELPFTVGSYLDGDQIAQLLEYNAYDVEATLKFYKHSLPMLKLRTELSQKYGRNFTNHNDTKIGKDFFTMNLEDDSPGCCYRYVGGRKQVQQTKRKSITFNDFILPTIQFTNPEFKRILQWFKQSTVTETKNSVDLSCVIKGLEFKFGTGGIHGSVSSQSVVAGTDYIIEDWDVASYYPNIAIQNGFFPEHLGENFCTIYKQLYEQRKTYAKGTVENAVYKLALNGTYGDSNNPFSPFYDPKFTMSITINGQLLLCMLAETLMQLESLRIIQINTDGLTIKYPSEMKDWVHSVSRWWEKLTSLQLENVRYHSMHIKNVSNYIAQYTDGRVKRKGAYEYDKEWHQDHSALVVPKAAERALLYGEDVRDFIMSHTNPLDFMLREKVNRNSRLEIDGVNIGNIVRYYISEDGNTLEKVMPPTGVEGSFKFANKLTPAYIASIMNEIGEGVWDERIHTKNKSVYAERRSNVQAGWKVTPCNKLEQNDYMLKPKTLNYEWYIAEAEKLVNEVLTNVN